MESAVFVARERELEQLDGFLDKALAGQGQVCFVTGEAGSGKTALVTEFARRAQEAHEDLVVAVGQSDAQTGIGDPYLPFREVLGQLTGDVEAKLAQGAITDENASRLRKLLVLSAQALVEVGPDLVGIFVPGVGLATRVGAFLAEKVGWLDELQQLAQPPRDSDVPGAVGVEQDHIFEQYTNVLNRLAEQQPLLLLLDDLQWVDAASIGLLFRLGRRIGGSRILIMGTYRPEEVALGRPSTSSGQVERHPLEKVLAEFKRYYGDLAVDLDAAKEAEGRGFVDAFLDTESNRLGEGFRSALFQHTDGHPLFTIELLRDMQERGDLVRDERGRWVEGSVLDWTDLPDRAEGVIEERIGRLEAELRETLTVGSVEGEQFTAEVVARVQTIEVRGLIRRLSQKLERQHRLVTSRGMRRVNGQRLSLYRFQHNLFQAYLYNDLDEVERICLHEDVGTALESLYGMRADQVAVPLARHFVEAGIGDKAARYLRLAGEQAAARYANAEAVDYFGRALEFTPEKEITGRYALLLAREKIYDVQGERMAQAQDLAALGELAEMLDDDRRRAEVSLRQAKYAEVTCDYPASATAAQTAVRLAQAAQDVNWQAAGHLQWGRALLRQGSYEAAGLQCRETLSLARAAGLRRVEANGLRNLGSISYFQGDYAEASAYIEQALSVCRELGDRWGETAALNNLAIVSDEQGDYAGAKAYYEQALQIGRELGNRWGQSASLNNLGVVYEGESDYARARACYEQALGIKQEIGDRQGEALGLMNIAKLLTKLGDYSKSRAFYQQSLQLFREIGDRQGESEGLYYLSLLCHQLGDDESAREHGQQALVIAQDLGDRSSQGYALTYLGHALAGLHHLPEAADAYQQALVLRQESDLHHLAMEPLAGLARVSLAQADLTQAQAYVEQILSYLDGNTLYGTAEPLRVYLTCYQVLDAVGDPRARTILTTAYQLLQEQAAEIGDEDLRDSFLKNVPAHREILSEFAKGQQTGKDER
jgi:adenylate cyclase